MYALRLQQSSLLLRSASRSILRGAPTVVHRNCFPTSRLGALITQPQGTLRRFSVFTRRKIQGGDGLKAQTVPTTPTPTSRWRLLAWFVKITRIPILLSALYTLGYQQGVVDTVRNPLKLQQGTFEELCLDMGVRSGEDIEIISERTILPKLARIGWIRDLENNDKQTPVDPRAQKVADIGREIIQAARLYVRQQLQEASLKAKEQLDAENKERLADSERYPFTQVEYMKRLQEDSEVKKWVHALERVEGYSMDGIKNWQYILVGTPVPNAFVSEMLPQRFFVTTALFEKFVDNDDELAMVLGHEISHLILGHISGSNLVEYMFRGLEIVLLMLDPTEGMLSLGIASFLASVREALVAAHSRGNESEADELGIKLAAMACFDTRRGSRVFLKMHEAAEASGRASNDLMSSHPPSLDRYEEVKQMSEDENLAKYSQCQQLRRRLQRVLTPH